MLQLADTGARRRGAGPAAEPRRFRTCVCSCRSARGAAARARCRSRSCSAAGRPRRDGAGLVEDGQDADEVFNIQFTSGTTGTPKGATLTHFNIVNNGFFVGEGMRLTREDRVCIPVPLYHCFGMVLGVLAAMTHGAASVLSGGGLRCRWPCCETVATRALHGAARRADHVHRGARASALRGVRSVLAAHRHHGGLALSDRR